MTPKIIDKQEKREQIIKAAVHVFASLGLPNTKMVQIAEAAGIGKGTIYEYFKNKDELFIAAYHSFIVEFGTHINQKLESLQDPTEKLKGYFEGWIEMLDSDFLQFADIILDMWAQGLRLKENDDSFHLGEMYRQYRIQITAILDEGIRQGKFKSVNTTITSSIIIGTLDGLLIQWIMDKNIYQLKEAILQLSDIILDGLTEGS
ncbi:TetR/AcrR family transcriptional regulator [candidate division KSB1 bacterium]|nr:TetR/AcrR family transcriptional regulator [candidate division KSB1 bacterium]